MCTSMPCLGLVLSPASDGMGMAKEPETLLVGGWSDRRRLTEAGQPCLFVVSLEI